MSRYTTIKALQSVATTLDTQASEIAQQEGGDPAPIPGLRTAAHFVRRIVSLELAAARAYDAEARIAVRTGAYGARLSVRATLAHPEAWVVEVIDQAGGYGVPFMGSDEIDARHMFDMQAEAVMVGKLRSASLWTPDGALERGCRCHDELPDSTLAVSPSGRKHPPPRQLPDRPKADKAATAIAAPIKIRRRQTAKALPPPPRARQGGGGKKKASSPARRRS